ncbi:MAG: phosphatidate cytidylyltransferase [Coriobacteriales bacterium]|jgi:phosphatidate cytidylyltransferase|nr:phosphatidate cytidylyltransferase [Coriobacteriales bacterium]
MTKRVVTGLLIALTTIVFILAHPLVTALFLAALSGICAWEFYAMLRSDAKLPNEIIGTAAAALYPLSYYFLGFSGILSLTTLFALALLIWYVFYTSARITDVAVTLFGALYTGLMLTSLILIRQIPPADPDLFLPEIWGGVLVLIVVFSTFANDAAAYFVGSKFGKHKMAPRISPAKSWEGFLAGLVASVAVWCLVLLVPGFTLGWGWVIFGGILCGWIGILGDLVESRIKRSTGHKDSSNLLPGHGGFLDRVDSLILVGAAASILLRFAGAIG